MAEELRTFAYICQVPADRDRPAQRFFAGRR